MCFRIWWTLGKLFLHPAGYGSIFSAKSCWDAWRSGSQLARGQVNMADEAKLHSPIHSTFEALVVQGAVAHCRGELGPFCWPMPAAESLQFLVQLINLLSMLLRCNGFAGIQKVAVDQTSSRPPKWPWLFFWCKFGFGKCFGVSSQTNRRQPVENPLWKSTFQWTSQSDWEMVHCCCIG